MMPMTFNHMVDKALAKLVQDDLGLDIIRSLGSDHRDKLALVLAAGLHAMEFGIDRHTQEIVDPRPASLPPPVAPQQTGGYRSKYSSARKRK